MEEDEIYCYGCGSAVNEAEASWVDGSSVHMCADCYAEMVHCCRDCGLSYIAEDMNRFGEDVWVCDTCSHPEG